MSAALYNDYEIVPNDLCDHFFKNGRAKGPLRLKLEQLRRGETLRAPTDGNMHAKVNSIGYKIGKKFSVSINDNVTFIRIREC